MRSQWSFEVTSLVLAPADMVWRRIVTPEGINDEMRPWMTMSLPRGVGEVSIETIRVGVPVGRAWLRLFGVLPFDYDRLTLTELEPGRRFHEVSTMLSMRRWVHDRTVEATTDRTAVVTDRVTLEPRVILRLAGPLLQVLLRAFFGHRHRRLRRHFER
ncbi:MULTISPECIES: hypothetical protein [unclassified Pseudofrankia]|uniref:hypothetical protein n=1 Tax=unclassified Pseudofrankia TaxID=2994372 RepID=UPI0008DB2468|nr:MULTISPECIES: hypothetical protein [unclassified Pseudofrankia]MDT3443165.1 hypothetical protein [Pseudofrankia sp. BMG5.37]OHV58942.1 hypothetical protein BCD48_05920 [Pseudofrankia sp. BMG5.36]